MLTVAREMAHAVSKKLAHWGQHELSPDASDAEQNALLGAMLGAALESATDAVSHTPEQLEVLADAGVVDAGALGLAVIVRGAIAGLAGEEVQLPEIPHYEPARTNGVHHADSRYRYCTNFAVIGESLDRRRFEPLLEALGDSVLVVGDEATLRVHIHTDDPDAAKALFEGVGAIENEDIADMRVQMAERAARLGGRTAAVAVAAGRRAPAHVRAARGRGRRRRPDAEPVHQRHPQRDRRRPNPGGDRPARIRRTCSWPRRRPRSSPTRRRWSSRPGPSRAPWRRSWSWTRRRPQPRTPSASRASSTRSGSAALRRPPGTTSRAASRSARRSASRRIRSSPGGSRSRRSLKTLERLVDGAEIVTIIEGEEAPITFDDLDLALPDGVELELHRGGQPNWHWLIATQ